MTLPLAVDPNNPRPGFYFKVDLLRGTTSAGAQGLKALMISPPAAVGGNIVIGTEIRPVFSKEDVEVAAGKCLGYYAYQALLANDPQCLVDLIVCAGSGGASATATLTFGSAPASNMSFDLYVMGWVIPLTWNVGESTTVAATNAAAKINQYASDLYVIASPAAAVVTLTARAAGPAGNDVRVRIKTTAGAGGTATLSGATLAGGTTEVDMTTALSTAAVNEYDFILICASNADAQSASGTANPGRLATHIDTYLASGSTAKLQQGIYGSTGSIASAKTNAIARNHTNLCHVNSVNDESLPCELAAAELGDRMRRRRLKPNANRVLQPLKRVRGSADKAADQPTDPEAIDALNNGVSLVGYTASGTPMILRSVTTHSLDTAGNPDRRVFDVPEVDGLYDYMKDMRSAVPQQFQSPDGQVNIIKNRASSDEELPPFTVEERDVRTFVVERTKDIWIPNGVIDGAKYLEAVDSNQMKVEINASDPTQMDIFVPAACVKIAAKFGFYLAKVA
jgi:phage tail sheath gpL-like